MEKQMPHEASRKTALFREQKLFGDIAIEMGFIDKQEANYIASQQNISNQEIGRLFIEKGILNHDQVAKIIARQYDYPYKSLKNYQSGKLTKLIPVSLMKRHQFIPFQKGDDKLTIAISDPRNFLKAAYDIEMYLDLDINVVISSEVKIGAIIRQLETLDAENLLGSASDSMQSMSGVVDTDEEYTLSGEKVTAEESPIVKLVDSTILDAINKKASDIHFEASGTGIIVRYRIDGMLHQATSPLEKQFQSPIISRIKVMSELDISEKRVPQDGRFKLNVHGRSVDFRISILPTIFGEDAVIRILDQESIVARAGQFSLEGLDLPKNQLVKLKRMVHAPYGMFLMTGPTGSGKTTTLYRALSEVNDKDVKIITIEDPVEYQLDGIVQLPVNEKKGLTFAKGLRSILRHDPDKILVGEIRDPETAQIALQSALTGHLVFTTVHANRAFEVIHRFSHMGIDENSLMAALNCIASQLLIRTLCKCKQTYIPSNEELTESGINPLKRNQYTFYEAKGCNICKGTGYAGRKAILELIELDDEMRSLFVKKAPSNQIKEMAIASGTIFLRKAAMDAVFAGQTTLKEANRVTFMEPGFVEKNEWYDI